MRHTCSVPTSVAEPELPGAASFEAAPEPIFYRSEQKARAAFYGGSGSCWIFFESKKYQYCSCNT